MRRLSFIILVCFCFSALTPGAEARELVKYKGEITVPIVENDTVFARNKAFQNLQNMLMDAAIRDLVGPSLFEEYKSEISRNRDLQPSNFLVSAKVLSEYSDQNNFTMQLEGSLQMSALANELRKMNLVLVDDPWVPVTVVVEESINIQKPDLQKRLERFHITISNFRSISLTQTPEMDLTTKELAGILFSQFPQSKIIYHIDSIPQEGSDLIRGIRAQIFRRSDHAQISLFQLDIPNAVPHGSLDDITIAKFLRLFTTATLQIDLYDEGLESTIELVVEGLFDPFNRTVFEEEVLRSNRSVKSIQLTELSADRAVYILQSNYTLEELNSFFSRHHSRFYFITEKISSTVLLVESFYRYTNQATALKEWQTDSRILDLISEFLHEDSPGSAVESVTDLFMKNRIQEEYIPQFEEREKNDNSLSPNRLPPSTLIVGSLSTRADEDIFQLTRDITDSTLVVELIQLGKTALSPQLRLYDKDFVFINNYNLAGKKPRFLFSYTFKDDVPNRLYLRLSDRVGYIQGETGGFKTFYYLLKYYWQSGDQITQLTGTSVR